MKLFNRVFIFILFFLIILNAQDGSFDTSFDSDGIVSTDIATDNDRLHDIAVQPDGKIVAVGKLTIPGDFYNYISLTRYNINGTLDTSFDSDGIVITQLSAGYSEGNAVAIQSDGKIVLVGQSPGALFDELAILRYNSNGSLDITFGNNGIVTMDLNSEDDVGFDVLIQPDGKILVASTTRFGTSESFIIRLNSNGSPDATFGGSGIGWISNAILRRMAIQSDGKIVVACSYLVGASAFHTVRMHTNGALDFTFGNYGEVTTDITEGFDRAMAILIQPDDKIVVGGSSYDGSNNSFSLVRYNSDGSLDLSFSDDGNVITPIGSGNAVILSMDIQPDGKIVASGYASINGNSLNLAITRYNSNGSLDNTFGSNGILTPTIGTSSSQGESVIIQSDGKILVGGSGKFISNFDFYAARFNSSVNLSLDIRTFLEGPFNGVMMSGSLTQIPFAQPYNTSPWNYSGTETVTLIPPDVMDWVLLELRTTSDASSIVKRVAAFINESGKIVNLDGSTPLTIKYYSGNYYIVVYHKNHLPIMSSGLVYISP